MITIFPKTIQYLALDESETGVLSLGDSILSFSYIRNKWELPTGGPYQEQLRALEVEHYTNLYLDRRLVLSVCATRILLFSYFTFPRQGGKNLFFSLFYKSSHLHDSLAFLQPLIFFLFFWLIANASKDAEFIYWP